jgi:hypothetical protein
LRYDILTDRVLPLSQLHSVRVLSWKDLEDKSNKGKRDEGKRHRKILRYCGIGAANIELCFGQETIWLGVDQSELLCQALLKRS